MDCAAIEWATSSADRSFGLVSLESLAGCQFQTTATRHFALVHEAQAEDVVEMADLLEDAYRRFYTTFSEAGFQLSRPEGPLVWIRFGQQEAFIEYARRTEGMDLSWLDGYYSMRSNRVAVVQPSLPSPSADALSERFDMARVAHELAHQLAFNSGLQKQGVMYPVWVSEGMATNFELAETMDVGESPSESPRGSGLAAMYAAGEMTPLRDFVVQVRTPVDARARGRQYAQAWAFFRFLFLEHPANLRRYLNAIAERPFGVCDADALLREFAVAFGPPEALESAWNLFVAREVRSVSLRQTRMTAGSP